MVPVVKMVAALDSYGVGSWERRRPTSPSSGCKVSECKASEGGVESSQCCQIDSRAFEASKEAH